jgi:hypothetical protein
MKATKIGKQKMRSASQKATWYFANSKKRTSEIAALCNITPQTVSATRRIAINKEIIVFDENKGRYVKGPNYKNYMNLGKNK